MHGTDRDVAAGGFNVLVEDLVRESGMPDSRAGPVELSLGPYEYTRLMRQKALARSFCEPLADLLDLVLW